MKRLYPFKKNGRFYQTEHTEHESWLFSTLMLLFESLKRGMLTNEKKDAQKWCVTPSFQKSSELPVFTWLGHSTFLIQVGGKNILTDPIFGNLSWVFSRIMNSVTEIKNLPKIDYILISHNHPDHMDSYSLKEILSYFPDVKVLAPMGDKAWFDYHGFKNSAECMWWDEISEFGLKFTFLPAKHWSQRGIFDKNKSLWGSWMIQYDGFSIYFAGDTSWDTHFDIIGKEFKSIDVAMMPIGPGSPREWMKDSHINAEEAGEAFLKLRARWFVPMHWGAFHLGLDKFKEPLDKIKEWWLKNKKLCAQKVLKISKAGQLVRCARTKIVQLVDSKVQSISSKVI